MTAPEKARRVACPTWGMARACRGAPGQLQAFVVIYAWLLGQALPTGQDESGQSRHFLEPCQTLCSRHGENAIMTCRLLLLLLLLLGPILRQKPVQQSDSGQTEYANALHQQVLSKQQA